MATYDLTNFKPLFNFCIPKKHQKTFLVSGVFRGYRNETWNKMGQ